MKIKFLGTGASQGIPSPFCTCRICENARNKGEKEVRSRSGLLIDNQLMIDYAPDNYFRAAVLGVNFTNVKNFLITHSHYDHFDVRGLIENRNHLQRENSKKQRTYSIYGNENVCEILNNEIQKAETQEYNKVVCVEPFKPFQVDKYRVTALNSEHMVSENSYVYLVEDGEKSYFHCCDSGELVEQTIEYLTKNIKNVSVAVFDATFGCKKEKYFGHMNIGQVVGACEKLKDAGVFTSQTIIYLTHISHSAACTHEELVVAAKNCGINVAYDGLEIEF